MTEHQHETSIGATGGLPGANAAPENSELTDDQLADSVAMSDVAAVEDDDHR
jgi:hypothetical protein